MRVVAAALLLLAAPLQAQTYTVSTVAGVAGDPGILDGPQRAAKFNQPTWLDFVPASATSSYIRQGDIYVVDRANNVLRKISGGTVSTYSVKTSLSGAAFPFDFGDPFGGGIVIEPVNTGCGSIQYDSGMYVADSGADQVVLVSFVNELGDRDGKVIVGKSHTSGALDGDAFDVLFDAPTGLARPADYGGVPFSRALFIADTNNHTIRRFRFGYGGEGCPRPVSVETLAGSAGRAGSVDAQGATARFRFPRGLAVAPDGSVVVADSGNHTIRRVAADGTVSTIAGEPGVPGSDAAHLNTPVGVDVDANGTIFITDTGNHAIRMLSAGGTLVTIAGLAGVAGYADGIGADARFSGPVGIRALPNGALLVADTSNHVIRLLTPAGLHRRAVRR